MATPPTTGFLRRERGSGGSGGVRTGERAADRVAGADLLELAHDLGRRLVLPQALEHRVPQLAVAGPLAEGHLGDQRGRGPVHAARLGAPGRVGERRRLPLQRAETLRQPRQRRLAEAAADAAGVAQGALLVVDAEQEGAEPVARPRRLGEAADDELLAAAALGLQPRARAPTRVGTVGALRHQALEALEAGLLEDCVAAPLDVVAVAHRAVQVAAAAPEQPLQPELALGQRQLAQVLAALEQKVEGDIGDVLATSVLEHALQRAEVADPLLNLAFGNSHVNNALRPEIVRAGHARTDHRSSRVGKFRLRLDHHHQP